MRSDPVPWTPRAYQETALQFALEGHGMGLMLDPGLGKTSTYLAQICVLRDRKEITKTLVSAPMRVAQTVWPVEAQKWKDFNHLRVCDLTEREDWQREELLAADFEVYVINPESTHRILNPQMFKGKDRHRVANRWGFDHFIADESTRWADPTTQRFKAIEPCLEWFNYRNIATGTMMPNGEHQLFGQCYLLDYGAALGKFITHFRQMYMHPNPFVAFTYDMNPGAGARVLERVAHILLRMKAKDHLEMPELIFNQIQVKLPPPAQAQYDQFERDFLIKLLDETIPAFNKASLGMKCRQLANGFIYSQEVKGVGIPFHDEKLKALGQLLEEMQGRPLLLMYEFIEDGKMVKERFPQAINITGVKNLQQTIDDFNAGRIPLLIGHPRSAGHGLNLQECCHDICWYGVTWDLELWLQAIARIWRQGQKSPVVTNHIIMAESTTDEGVLAGLLKKNARQDDADAALIQYAKARLGVK